MVQSTVYMYMLTWPSVISHGTMGQLSVGMKSRLSDEKCALSPCAGSTSLFVCVEILRPSQPNRVMSSAVSLPNHTFTGQP